MRLYAGHLSTRTWAGLLFISRALDRRRVGLPPFPFLVLRRCHYSPRKLDLPSLDQKWREKWQKAPVSALDKPSGSKEDDNNKKNMYILPMFPYPSGRLHMGHLRVYTIADVMARFKCLQGHPIILPMGWDAFGLPAENAAIERGINPAVWTRDNISGMKEQLELMNGSWDWSREVTTCDPSFYKHTQRIFLLLYEKGLAYQADAEVNFDPVDQTVLANEQVDANGCSWRSGAKVEKRRLKQWFLRISEFRESLLDDLDVLEKGGAWPANAVAMQRNWLGKSRGALVEFPVLPADGGSAGPLATIEIFTTRLDTLFGAQYLALAATHPIVENLASQDAELQAFLDTLPSLPPDSRAGYMLPQLRAINPLAFHEATPEATKASIPIYVAPYVLGDYGDGAIMGVPAHDRRDQAFWREHNAKAPVRKVLAASEDDSLAPLPNEAFVGHGFMTESSGIYKGKRSEEVGKMLIDMLEAAGMAKSVEKWRLRDWLISRQRYWGTPIPIIHCSLCGAVPVSVDQLPVELPQVQYHWDSKKAGNPLESAHEWINTTCPKCSGPAKRDTSTMDTFVDSSWYYMRYLDPHNASAPFSGNKVNDLLPVDIYIGGIEHAILHLLYARFIYKFLMSSPLMAGAHSPSVNSHHDEAVVEPFSRLITQGMVHGKTFSDPSNGRFLRPHEIDHSDPCCPKIAASGQPAIITFEKMSKSKLNGIDPVYFMEKYGADATRAHMLFQAPISELLNWDEDKIAGVSRWLTRLHDTVVKTAALQQQQQSSPAEEVQTVKEHLKECSSRLSSMTAAQLSQWDTDSAVWRDLQKAVDSVTASYEKVYALNTIVSDLMSLTNTLTAHPTAHPVIRREALSAMLRMLAPITPALAEECWSILHPGSDSLFRVAEFPTTDGTTPLLQPRTQKCAVQVNRRVRCVVDVPKPPPGLEGDALQEYLMQHICKAEAVQQRLMSGPRDIRKAAKVHVVGEGKVISFVV